MCAVLTFALAAAVTTAILCARHHIELTSPAAIVGIITTIFFVVVALISYLSQFEPDSTRLHTRFVQLASGLWLYQCRFDSIETRWKDRDTDVAWEETRRELIDLLPTLELDCLNQLDGNLIGVAQGNRRPLYRALALQHDDRELMVAVLGFLKTFGEWESIPFVEGLVRRLSDPTYSGRDHHAESLRMVAVLRRSRRYFGVSSPRDPIDPQQEWSAALQRDLLKTASDCLNSLHAIREAVQEDRATHRI